MFIELGPGFHWSFGGLLRDLRFDARYRRHFGPTAVVGHTWWQHWGALLLDPFYQVPLRFFPESAKNEAMIWLLSQPE